MHISLKEFVSDKVYGWPVRDLHLGERVDKLLRRAKVLLVGQLVTRPEDKMRVQYLNREDAKRIKEKWELVRPGTGLGVEVFAENGLILNQNMIRSVIGLSVKAAGAFVEAVEMQTQIQQELTGLFGKHFVARHFRISKNEITLTVPRGGAQKTLRKLLRDRHLLQQMIQAAQ